MLTEFRQRLIGYQVTQLLLDRILERCQEAGLLKGTKKQRTDSTRVLAAIRLMNRVELVGETMRRALDELATVAPEWLLARMQSEWGERYIRKIDTHRIRRNQDRLQALAKTIGQDGYALLQEVYAEQELVKIRNLPAI